MKRVKWQGKVHSTGWGLGVEDWGGVVIGHLGFCCGAMAGDLNGELSFDVARIQARVLILRAGSRALFDNESSWREIATGSFTGTKYFAG
jgi:hypothetical protein